MTKAHIRLVAFLLCLAMLFSLTACQQGNSGTSGTTVAKKYNVTYNLNYDGATSRVHAYQEGVTPMDWKATREGYNIDGWYTDAACQNKFDFSTKVTSNLTLYAGWKEKPGMTTVTFDFGYAGAVNKVIEIEKGSTINKKLVPSKSRYGKTFEAWCVDEALTTEWDFDEDVVEDTTVLHAKFRDLYNLERDENGNIVYDNVNVFVWNGTGSFSADLLKSVVDAFNEEYAGKIKVTYSNTLASQQDTLLRIQQTAELMRCYTTYYPIADIYSLAGIEVNNEDYYAGAVRESMNNGVMLQTPFAAFVPYIVYNKALMQKYSPNGLPTNYSQLSAVLQAAAEGEKTNAKFKSILTTTNWEFKECSSYTAFSQNDADYFTYSNGAHVSTWKEDGVMERAQTALRTTYDLFGVNGLNKGSASTYAEGDMVTSVASGNALMAMISWKGQESNIANNDKLGVMSLSGLFTDNTDEASKHVPVYTLGVAFYNGASTVIADPVRMCASAVFADYLSKNAYRFASTGFVPVHKETAEVEEYKNSEDKVIKLMKSVCDPNNYWTLPGMANTKYIFNAVASESILVPYLTDTKASTDDISSKLTNLYSQVAGLLG